MSVRQDLLRCRRVFLPCTVAVPTRCFARNLAAGGLGYCCAARRTKNWGYVIQVYRDLITSGNPNALKSFEGALQNPAIPEHILRSANIPDFIEQEIHCLKTLDNFADGSANAVYQLLKTYAEKPTVQDTIISTILKKNNRKQRTDADVDPVLCDIEELLMPLDPELKQQLDMNSVQESDADPFASLLDEDTTLTDAGGEVDPMNCLHPEVKDDCMVILKVTLPKYYRVEEVEAALNKVKDGVVSGTRPRTYSPFVHSAGPDNKRTDGVTKGDMYRICTWCHNSA